MLTVTDVSLQFQGSTLYKHVDLKFAPGNCYGIIGANGAGKSTLLRILSGALEPTTGSVSMVAERRADLVVNSILKYVTDIDEVKGLGFCVSIAHAQFMARYFNTHGIPSMALTGDSPDEERNAAKQRLVSGELRFLFVVDIYNEGVDIPEVNTVLFLRPTESLTVFLQQLGRGLRLAENKDCLTVLDFIGQANKKYNFEEKFAALLSNTTRSVSRELKEGFVSAPKGCYIQLEKYAAKYVLDNISASYDRTSGLVARAAAFTEDTGLPLTLGNFLDYYHLDPRAIYSKRSASAGCASAQGRHPIYRTFGRNYDQSPCTLCSRGFPQVDSFFAGASAKIG